MAVYTDSEFISVLSERVKNPALSDTELAVYVDLAKADISSAHYEDMDYNAQILDTAILYLVDDKKMPEISGVTQGGVSTSFRSEGHDSIKRRVAARRQAAWMHG